MKNKRSNIRLFILLTLGIFILTGGSAAAELADDFERSCDGIEAGACLEIYNDNETKPVYIIKAVSIDKDTGVISDATLNGNWPSEEEGGPAVFTYWAGVSKYYLDPNYDVSKPSAWSYIVFNLGGEPLDADPPGAQLNLESIPSCASEDEASANSFYYKLNPSVNFKGDAIFKLYAPPGTTIDPCNNGRAYVLFGKECDGGLLAVPQVGQLPFVQKRRFWCSEDVYIEVQYDQCTGIPDDPIKYYNLNVSENPSDIGYEKGTNGDPISPFVYATLPDVARVDGRTDRNFKVTNWGPAYGTLLCTDSDPVFVWKDRAYFCEQPSVP